MSNIVEVRKSTIECAGTSQTFIRISFYFVGKSSFPNTTANNAVRTLLFATGNSACYRFAESPVFACFSQQMPSWVGYQPNPLKSPPKNGFTNPTRIPLENHVYIYIDYLCIYIYIHIHISSHKYGTRVHESHHNFPHGFTKGQPDI